MFVPVSFTLLVLSSIVCAKIVMNHPRPFSFSKYENDSGPIDGGGYPCKYHDYEDSDLKHNLRAEQYGALEFFGTTAQGGGSCQISITYDKPPTSKSKFKVLHSIMGGCPVENMFDSPWSNLGAGGSYGVNQFPVSKDLPYGDAVLAWTWFGSKEDRGMHMVCAPVTIKAPYGKRDLMSNKTLIKRDNKFYDSLPDMFVADIGNGCETVDGNLEFPNPGKSVTKLADKFVKPKGKC